MLPPLDVEFLRERWPNHSVHSESNMTCVLIREFDLPTGFNVASCDLLLRLAPGYPDVAPDMWWFEPAVLRIDGVPITATDVTESHLQRRWQRWSRHFQPGQWRSGVDSLESYLASIKRELMNSAPAVAA
jgi:hypothetical protein